MIGIVLLALLETFSFCVFWIKQGKAFSYSQIMAQQELQAGINLDIGTTGTGNRKVSQIIHPYLGYVYNPAINNPRFIQHHENPVNRFGFIDEHIPLWPQDPNKVRIGIVGGSVAYWFSVKGNDALIEELKKDERFKDKEIVIVRLAMGGYKQPQQLMALNYVLALGGGFEYLINIDGFNEVALPECENVKFGVFPFFPRDWKGRLERLPDFDSQLTAGETLYLMNKRRDLARNYLKWKTRYSVTLQLIWKFQDHRLERAIAQSRMRLKQVNPERGSFEVEGPGTAFFNEENLYPELAAFWMRCSIQLDKICRSNNIRYFHFLQPCQHVEGSKPMGEEEKRIAINEKHPYRAGAIKGYPALRALADDLRAAGVNFEDLTMLFKDVEEPLYIDDCCHFNEKGNEIMGRRIASRILGSL